MDDGPPRAGGVAGGDRCADARFSRTSGAPAAAALIARRWLDAFGTIALATVIKTWGSAPVPVGGQLVIGPDDRFEGSVSGGCVEAAVIAEAQGVMASGQPKCLAFGVGDETAWRVGLPCGGRIEVFVERLKGDADAAYLDAVLSARAKRCFLAVDTDLATGHRSLHRDASRSSSDVSYSSDIRSRLESGESLLIEEAGSRRFIQALVPPVHVILVGAGHIAQVLADIALRVGFQVTVVDPRTAFSSQERFAGIAVRHEWPEQALPALGLDARTAVVTLAHEARLDDETLLAALRSACFYVGALGSRRTHEKRVERLGKAGLTAGEIARIDSPVGLPIGAKGPAEIAVSILGAIIRARRGDRA